MRLATFVSIKELYLRNSDFEGQILAKRINLRYLSEPLINVLEYMLNPNGDEMNPEGYNSMEKDVAARIRDVLRMTEEFERNPNNPNKPEYPGAYVSPRGKFIELYGISNPADNDEELIKISGLRTERITDHPEIIIPREFEGVKYNSIDFAVDYSLF